MKNQGLFKKTVLLAVWLYAGCLMAQQDTRLVINPKGHTSVIPETVVSSDGKYIVSVSHDKTVKVWSSEYGNITKEFFGQRGDGDLGKLFCVALSPKDQYLAVGGFLIEQKDNKPTALIRIYDFKRKQLKTVLRGHTNVVHGLAFSPDGKHLASTSTDGNVLIWDLENMKVKHTIKAHNDVGRAVCFINDEKLAAGGWDNQLHLIDVNTGKIVKTISKSGKISGMTVSRELGFLYTYADGEPTVVVWNDKLEKKHEINGYMPLSSIAARGKNVMLGQERYPYAANIYVYTGGEFKPTTLFNALDNSVTSCGFISDEVAYVAGGSDNEIIMHNYSQQADKSGNVTYVTGGTRLKGYGSAICAVGYSAGYIGFTDLKCNEQYGQSTIRSFFDLHNNQVYKLSKEYEKFFRGLKTTSGNFSLEHKKGGKLNYPDAVLQLSENGKEKWSMELDDNNGYRHTVYGFAGKWAVSGSTKISLINTNGEQRAQLIGHEGAVLGLWSDSLGNYLFSSGRDQTIRLWDISSVKDEDTYMPYEKLYPSSKEFFRKEYPSLDFTNEKGMRDLYEKVLKDFGDDTAHYLKVVQEIRPIANFFIGLNNEWVIWTNEGYYKSSKEGARFVAYLLDRGSDQDARYYPFEQFDLKYNRPDIINRIIGVGDTMFNHSLHKAYLRRLEKSGLKEEDLSADKHLPVVEINSVAGNTSDDYFKLDLAASDDLYGLYKIKVYNNDVPVFGTAGFSIPGKDLHRYSQVINVPLVPGENKISVSVVNHKGAESMREETRVFCTKTGSKGNLYVVTIGVSEYKEKSYNLKYAAKDASDITTLFSQSAAFEKVNTKTFTNAQVTKSMLPEIDKFLATAGPNDQVLVFVAGHGVLDQNFDYYFATYDMDFTDPSKNGLAYSEIEKIMDKIKSLKKLLFLDTCHSGEVDKDDIEKDTKAMSQNSEVQFRSVGAGVQHKSLGMMQTTELMKEVFTDLRKGTGAHIISSSGGYELSAEGKDWNNGLFTYVLKEGIMTGAADLDGNKTISISELKQYVSETVMQKSKGLQAPTSRIENINFDFKVW